MVTSEGLPLDDGEGYVEVRGFASKRWRVGELERRGFASRIWRERLEGLCERASCYARANLPRTIPKSYWSWPVANREGSILTCTVVSPNTMEVHVPQCLYACLTKTEVPN